MKDSDQKASLAVTSVSDIIGDWGRWQRNIFIFFFFGAMFSAWHGLSLSFCAPNIDFWCESPIPKNVSHNVWINETKADTKLQCFPNATDPQQACTKWQYDHSFYQATITSEWDLVCNRSWLSSLTQSFYMGGMMFAVIFFGQLADKIGRFPVIMTGIVIELIAGALCAGAVSIEMFLIARFLLAVGASGRWASGFVAGAFRPQISCRSWHCHPIRLALGYVIIPGMAYLVPNFRYLQLICTVPQCLLLIGWWLVPESPRWLLTQNKIDLAMKSLEKGAINNGYEPDDLDRKIKQLSHTFEEEDEEKKLLNKASLWDLWKSSKMRRKTLFLYFTWFVNTFVYYGLSLNTNNLGGNPFLNFLVAGAVEFPAYLLCMYLLRKFGRKKPLSGALFGGGLACLLTLFFPGDDYVTLRVVLAMIGKFCIAASFAMIYVYSAEIFPTVVRNVGVGSSSMVGRIGSILAPFVKEIGQITHPSVPLTIFGVLAIADSLLILCLPETCGRDMPDTIKDAEDFDSDVTREDLMSNDLNLSPLPRN